jgi:hypothetical protein
VASSRTIHGALGRSLAALTLGAAQAQAERETALATLDASDMSQVVQLQANGKAGVTPIWIERQVALPYPFVQQIDPTRADSGLSTPHFTTGIELLTDGHVLIDAQVRAWIHDESDANVVSRTRLDDAAYAGDADGSARSRTTRASRSVAARCASSTNDSSARPSRAPRSARSDDLTTARTFDVAHEEASGTLCPDARGWHFSRDPCPRRELRGVQRVRGR